MKAIWIALGSYTIAWGLWIGNPFWDAFRPQAALYSEMKNFMPEWAWGLHAITIGIAIIYGIVKHWPRGIVWGYVASMYHWGLIAIFYALGDWHNTGVITSLAIMSFAWVAWKFGRPVNVTVHPLD